MLAIAEYWPFQHESIGYFSFLHALDSWIYFSVLFPKCSQLSSLIDKLFQKQTNTETTRWKTMRFYRWHRFDAVSFEWKLKKMHKHTFIVEFHRKFLVLCLRQPIFGAISLNSIACRFKPQTVGAIHKCLQQQNFEFSVMDLNSSLSEYYTFFGILYCLVTSI